MEEDTLFERLNLHRKNMSKGQKKLADFLMAEYDKAAFMTAADIGKAVGVSESTVVRFAPMLGYHGFPMLQKAMEEVVRNRINEAPEIHLDYENISRRQVLEDVFSMDMKNLKETLEGLNQDAFEVAMDVIMKARRVYLIGLRTAAPLAEYLGFYLKLMLDNVTVINVDNSNDIFEEMLRMNEEDCVIGISFPRYSLKTLRVLEFANRRNVSIIVLTDHINSPMNLYSSCNLIAKSRMTAAADSLTAPMCLINAMITFLMTRRKEKMIDRLEMLEEICNEYEIAGNDEIELVDDSDLEEQ